MLQELNPEQLAAVQHGDGPLLIVAGAGTGKTAALVHRVAHLIGRGADPLRILLLTFTRRAAAEMLRRVEAVLAAGAAGSGAPGGGDGRRQHAAVRRLRLHAPRRRTPGSSMPPGGLRTLPQTAAGTA